MVQNVDELSVGDLARVRVVDDVEHVVELAARRRKLYGVWTPPHSLATHSFTPYLQNTLSRAAKNHRG